jgi:hypothetical protein
VKHQVIPALSPDRSWAWTVSDGQFIIARFNAKTYAHRFCDLMNGLRAKNIDDILIAGAKAAMKRGGEL